MFALRYLTLYVVQELDIAINVKQIVMDIKPMIVVQMHVEIVFALIFIFRIVVMVKQ